MAQYLISVWHDHDYEIDFSSQEAQRQISQVGEFNADLDSADALVFACGLEPARTATVIRPDTAAVTSTEGPYAASDQQMGGFWIVEADDHDDAMKWARRAATACERPIEVRPVQG